MLFSLLFWMGAFDPVVSRDNYERLRVGLSERDLLKWLGRPHRVDDSAQPAAHSRLRTPYPRRLFWEDGEDRIWADVYRGRVTQFGATLDGEQYGPDPDEHPPELPGRKEPADAD